MMISWPVASEGTEDFRSNEPRDVELNVSTNKYFFTEGYRTLRWKQKL